MSLNRKTIIEKILILTMTRGLVASGCNLIFMLLKWSRFMLNWNAKLRKPWLWNQSLLKALHWRPGTF